MTVRHLARPLGLVAAFVSAAVTAGGAAAYHTNFVAAYCNYNAPTPTSYFTRDGSMTVALRGRWEGYQWGGGCWNDNDRDDSPYDPTQDPYTGGEGGDSQASPSRSGASRPTPPTRAPISGTCCATSTGRTRPAAS
jgi:hypothetical protein